HALVDGVQQGAGLKQGFVGVAYAQAAPKVDVVDAYARGIQSGHQIQDFIERVEIGRQLRYLRSDMAVDTHHVDAGQLAGGVISRWRFGNGDAELVVLQAGGNIRVGAWIDIGVDAQRDRRA